MQTDLCSQNEIGQALPKGAVGEEGTWYLYEQVGDGVGCGCAFWDPCIHIPSFSLFSGKMKFILKQLNLLKA